jgi:hypothetical protein
MRYLGINLSSIHATAAKGGKKVVYTVEAKEKASEPPIAASAA